MTLRNNQLCLGVNDVWKKFETENGVDAEKYFKIYSMLIDEVKEALPDLKIMIMEPFTLKGTGNDKYYTEFRNEVTKRTEKAKAIAEKYGFPFIPLQKKVDDAAKLAENSHWLVDGVHPTDAGHELIKRERIIYLKKYINDSCREFV
ncbi:MAG: hypothetical protein K5664_01490 [Firmicutes bacterium]|nr:hypothetical protein [Bacillota bacterium]